MKTLLAVFIFSIFWLIAIIIIPQEGSPLPPRTKVTANEGVICIENGIRDWACWVDEKKWELIDES